MRQKPAFTRKLRNSRFISLWQNIVILGMSLPVLAVMDSSKPLDFFDGLIAAFVFLFLLLEIFADKEQNEFQVKKYDYLKSGKKLEEIPSPYNRGFRVTGLWGWMRHPNYLGEQGFWVILYLFVISSGSCVYGIFNCTIFGSMLLLLIFAGSSRMTEGISASKYPEYKDYQREVFKYLPIRKYKAKD